MPGDLVDDLTKLQNKTVQVMAYFYNPKMTTIMELGCKAFTYARLPTPAGAKSPAT